jgi:predicted acetyltransferase
VTYPHDRTPSGSQYGIGTGHARVNRRTAETRAPLEPHACDDRPVADDRPVVVDPTVEPDSPVGLHRPMELVRPAEEHLESYREALRRGWSPSTEHDVSQLELAALELDPETYLAGLDDPDPQGRTVTLPDGTVVARLPSFSRWMWDGEFCGSINVRWLEGTTDLPPTCLGHVGYSVVPWKRRRGHATEALRQVLVETRARGLRLPFVEITTDPDNVASQLVIEANGGVLVERFDKGPAYQRREGLRYRVTLA